MKILGKEILGEIKVHKLCKRSKNEDWSVDQMSEPKVQKCNAKSKKLFAKAQLRIYIGRPKLSDKITAQLLEMLKLNKEIGSVELTQGH